MHTKRRIDTARHRGGECGGRARAHPRAEGGRAQCRAPARGTAQGYSVRKYPPTPRRATCAARQGGAPGFPAAPGGSTSAASTRSAQRALRAGGRRWPGTALCERERRCRIAEEREVDFGGALGLCEPHIAWPTKAAALAGTQRVLPCARQAELTGRVPACLRCLRAPLRRRACRRLRKQTTLCNAESRCRCGRGEPSPGTDEAAVTQTRLSSLKRSGLSFPQRSDAAERLRGLASGDTASGCGGGRGAGGGG
jgi:hypothetical protein